MAETAGEDHDAMSMGNQIPNPIPMMLLDGLAAAHTCSTKEQGSYDDGAMPEASLLPPLLEQQAQVVALGDDGSHALPDRDQLLLEHLSTVRYLARRIHERLPQHVDLDDLISAGVVGLIDAFSKFDHSKKVQFKSYAQFRIRGAILDSLRTLDWSPRELRRKGRAVEEAIRSATQRLGRAPLEQEIALAMNLSLVDYQHLLGDLKGLEIGSLHMERTEDSGDEELAYIPGAPEDDPLFRCLKGEMKQRLADAIDELPEKERLVLTLYYYEELTMKEIGLTLGVVESRVSQIHSSAVLRLRTALANLRSNQVPAMKPVSSVKRHTTRKRREA